MNKSDIKWIYSYQGNFFGLQILHNIQLANISIHLNQAHKSRQAFTKLKLIKSRNSKRYSFHTE